MVLVDVRAYPGSRRHPQWGRASLQHWLPAAGIEYVHVRELGGRRQARPDSPNGGWRELALRGYADHMASPEFADGLGRLEALAHERATVVMCSEAVWWRCHRRLLADFVSAVRGVPVRHLLHDGRLEEHRLSPGLRRRDDGMLVYDEGQPTLL